MWIVQEVLKPLYGSTMALPPAALRSDLGVVITAFVRYAPGLLKSFFEVGSSGSALKLLRPFSELVDTAKVTDRFVRNWIDLLAFLLSGVKADGTLAAEVVCFPLTCICVCEPAECHCCT